jgi:hypothetical protein
MIFAIVRGHRSGRATPSLRDAPERQFTLTTGRGSTCRERNSRTFESCRVRQFSLIFQYITASSVQVDRRSGF